jgi:hypothetical protein
LGMHNWDTEKAYNKNLENLSTKTIFDRYNIFYVFISWSISVVYRKHV